MAIATRHASPLTVQLVTWVLLAGACAGGGVDPVSTASGAATTTVEAAEPNDGAAPSATTPAPGPATDQVPGPTTTPATTTALPPLEPATFESIAGIRIIPDWSSYTGRSPSRWEQNLEDLEDIIIPSTADGHEQPAFWVPPRGDRPRPLLVILHSWSSEYTQTASIPFAMFAEENGWAVIAPDFRGPNFTADAMGSDLALQDVADAIDFAVSQEGVDPDRVYAVGFSGGGMMSLLVAARLPEKVTAVAAYTPVWDLAQFYGRSGGHYPRDIWRACGGDPRHDPPAELECMRRSPSSHLDQAREAGVPVYIGQGLYDSLVPPSQAAQAFNQLAAPEDRLTEDEVDAIDSRNLPDSLEDETIPETFFGEGDPAALFARRSGRAWLVLFADGHEMVYQPALRFFAGDPR